MSVLSLTPIMSPTRIKMKSARILMEVFIHSQLHGAKRKKGKQKHLSTCVHRCIKIYRLGSKSMGLCYIYICIYINIHTNLYHVLNNNINKKWPHFVIFIVNS